jgi:homoserine kinase
MPRAPVTATATAFAPGSIGNVGPGFDVLGLAVAGIGDRVTVELVEGPSRILRLTGRDAERVPHDPGRNCAVIAARAYLRARGIPSGVVVSIHKGLPLAGGLGGSAASSVAGAYAAYLATGGATPAEARPGGAWSDDSRSRAVAAEVDARLRFASSAAGGEARPTAVDREIVAAALAGETAVAGCHLDNIASAVLGGLALVRSVEPLDVVPLRAAAGWWVAVVTPRVRVETRAARELLPAALPRAEWVQQMANTAALVHAFATGDAALLARALDDRHAEPRRAPLIPHFATVKAAALAAGACGCSISGSGPTVFALAVGESAARRCAAAMQAAFGDVAADAHVGAVDRQGARAL